MSPLVTLAPAKVNLCLFVGEPREDGYHPLVSVFQAVSLADEVRLEPAPAGATADEVHCPGVEGPNLAAAALAAYRRASGWDGAPVRLVIDKRVPVAGGMGGGSADAAAALRLAAHAAGRADDPLVREIAPALGADVPSQVAPGRALVTGVGERVEDLPPPPELALVVVPSDATLSTAAVYREADRLGIVRGTAGLQRAEASLRSLLRAGAAPPPVNDLEPAARSLCPSIDAALEAVRRAGALAVLVSGSGPTVLGLFNAAPEAEAAAVELRRRHPRALAVGAAAEDAARVREAP